MNTHQDGEILKETAPGSYFQFRLVQADWKSLPDIWRKVNGGEWSLLISCASPSDVQRFF